jgi:hypothetical protein
MAGNVAKMYGGGTMTASRGGKVPAIWAEKKRENGETSGFGERLRWRNNGGQRRNVEFAKDQRQKVVVAVKKWNDVCECVCVCVKKRMGNLEGDGRLFIVFQRLQVTPLKF